MPSTWYFVFKFVGLKMTHLRGCRGALVGGCKKKINEKEGGVLGFYRPMMECTLWGCTPVHVHTSRGKHSTST